MDVTFSDLIKSKAPSLARAFNKWWKRTCKGVDVPSFHLSLSLYEPEGATPILEGWIMIVKEKFDQLACEGTVDFFTEGDDDGKSVMATSFLLRCNGWVIAQEFKKEVEA